MIPQLSLSFLKKSILLFWALYFLIVLITNVTDALQNMGAWSEDAAFVSGNYDLILKVISKYQSPRWLATIFFAGVIIWEAIVCFSFFVAWRNWGKEQAIQKANTACILAILLWMLFILMDELFIAYHVAGLESTHIRLFLVQMLSYILILLPNSWSQID